MSEAQSGLAGLRVLAVDDHRGMRDIISTILTGLGVGDVALRLEALIDHPRALVRTERFVSPDRRLPADDHDA